LSLYREALASIPLGVLTGVLAGGFCGFVGRKALGIPDGMLGTIMACPMAGLLLAGILVGFFQGKRIALALSRILLIVSVVVLSISLTPSPERYQSLGSVLFLGQIFLAQIGLALVITLRSVVWRVNYPPSHRGRIVVIIYLIITISQSLSVIAFTAVMDYWQAPFQMVYGISGVCGIICAYLFLRLRLHRERRRMRYEAGQTRRVRLLSGLSVLRRDGRFRRYMSWQMLNGFCTLIVESGVLVLIMHDVFHSNWLIGGSAISAIQYFVAALAGLVWARLYDRSNIFTMRFYGAIGWALSRGVLMWGVYAHNIVIVLISRIVSGLAMGVGRLNWRLGHMEFAPPEKDALYMGAHVSLTGLRGMAAPFVGIYLFQSSYFGPDGIWLIGLSGVGLVISAFGFLRMKGDAV